MLILLETQSIFLQAPAGCYIQVTGKAFLFATEIKCDAEEIQLNVTFCPISFCKQYSCDFSYKLPSICGQRWCQIDSIWPFYRLLNPLLCFVINICLFLVILNRSSFVRSVAVPEGNVTSCKNISSPLRETHDEERFLKIYFPVSEENNQAESYEKHKR